MSPPDVTASPCPCCQSTNLRMYFSHHDGKDKVICRDCGMSGTLDAWNRRRAHAGVVEALEAAQAFIGVMFGVGPDAVVPESVMSPIGVPIKAGAIQRQIEAALEAPS